MHICSPPTDFHTFHKSRPLQRIVHCLLDRGTKYFHRAPQHIPKAALDYFQKKAFY